MKTVTTKKIDQGRRKSLTITTTQDDETGIETQVVIVRKGKRATHTVIERNLATGELLTIDKLPVSPRSDTSWQTKLDYVAADLINDLAQRAEPVSDNFVQQYKGRATD